MSDPVVTNTEETGKLEAALTEAVDTEFVEKPKEVAPEETDTHDVKVEKPAETGGSEEQAKTEEQKKAEAEAAAAQAAKTVREEGEGQFFYHVNKKGEKRKISEKEWLADRAELTKAQQSRAEAERAVAQSRQFLDILQKGDPATFAKLMALANGDPETIKTLPPEVQVEVLEAQRAQKQILEQDQNAMKERIVALGREVTAEWEALSKDEVNYPGIKDQESAIFELMRDRLNVGVLTSPREAYLLLNADSIQTKHKAVVDAEVAKVRAEMEKTISAKVEEALKNMTAEDLDKRRSAVPGPGGGKPEKPKTQYPKGADLEDEIAADIASGEYKLFEPT